MKQRKILSAVMAAVMVLCFSAAALAAESFSDVDGHWAKDSIGTMAEKGIVNGYADGTFRPNGIVTRAEFAKMLYAAVGAESGTSSLENPFSDVKAAWYYDAVVALYHDGVIKGTSETEFSPNAPLNREQMVTLLDRAVKTYHCFALSADTSKKLDDFSDRDQISAFAEDSCASIYQAGLIKGIDGAFVPQGSATRAQVVTVLDRAMSAEKVLPVKIEQEDWVDAKQYVELSTGIKMAYVEMGQADGDPVILLHGHTDSSRTWSMTAQELAKDFHLYILDQRGSGDTEAPDNRAYSTLLFANDVNAFMDAAGLEKAHIVGHSMGSHIAQAFAILFPEKVDKLILMGSAYVTNSESYKYARESYAADDFDPTDAEFLNYWDYVTPGCWDGASYKDDAEEMLEYIKKDTAAIDIRAFVNPPTGSMLTSLANGYDQITAPTLLICGESDADNQAELSKALGKNYQGIIVYPGHNHSVQWEIPYEVGEDIAKYLKGEKNDKIAQSYVKELPKKISQEDWVANKQYVQLSTGIKMAYVEMGNAEGEDLILVHGMTDSSRTWSKFVPYLTETGNYHIYIIDNMGHGDSDKPDTRNYDLWDHAANLAAFMDAMELEKADLVGHSMGSGTVQAFAINYPERIDKMVMFGCRYADEEFCERSTYDMVCDPSFDPKDPGFLDMWDGNPNPVDEELMEYVKQDTGNIPAEAWKAIARGVSDSYLCNYLKDIDQDCLIVWGDLDDAAEIQKKVLNDIVNAKFVVYENVGHNIQWEQPERLAEDIDRYFQTGNPVSDLTDPASL
ncbi:MAG: alpha/beta fold hydrolase [Bacillota bacterium]|jgi:non-heme chloroperoxidase